MQSRRVSGLDERRLGEHAEPNDRARPGCRVVRSATRRLPENLARRIRETPRKGLIDPDKSVGNELFDLRGSKAERR
jgi:hypothetical protein